MRTWDGELHKNDALCTSQLNQGFSRMILQQDPKQIGRTDISDLDADPVVVWQHKHCKLTH